METIQNALRASFISPKSEWRSSLKGMETSVVGGEVGSPAEKSEWRSSLKGMETYLKSVYYLFYFGVSEWRSSLKGMETYPPRMRLLNK